MQETHGIFKALARSRPLGDTVLACLYTGSVTPAACAPMARHPSPRVGMPVFDLVSTLGAALAKNPAVHDGAIMIGRLSTGSPYEIAGWSYRLFPKSRLADTPLNKGSAFHSGLSMSLEPGVDAIYLVSGGKTFCFREGHILEL